MRREVSPEQKVWRSEDDLFAEKTRLVAEAVMYLAHDKFLLLRSVADRLEKNQQEHIELTYASL